MDALVMRGPVNIHTILNIKYRRLWYASARILNATNLVEKNSESFSTLLILQVCHFSGEHFNSCKNFHGRLKACEIFLCVKFKWEKSESMVFFLSIIGDHWGPPLKTDCLKGVHILLWTKFDLEWFVFLNVNNIG